MAYVVTKTSNNQFRFVLKAENGEVILHSETYEQKSSAQQGIISVQANSTHEERFDRKLASDGRHYFNVKAGNGQVIATSEMYSSEAAREAGIAAVKESGPS